MLRAHRYSLALVGAAATWGTATVISKRAVDEIEPLTLLPVQLAVSVVALTAAVRLTGAQPRWTPELRRLSLLGVLNPGLAYALSLAGLARITASMSVLLWAVEPLLILALAYWLLKDRVSLPMALYAGIAACGVILVVFQPASQATLVGVVLTIAGVAACAVYTVLSSKFLVDASAITVVWAQQVSAFGFSLVLFLGSFVVTDPRSLSGVSGTAWLSAVVAGALYYGVAFWFYVTGLKGVRAGYAGMFINLIPVFGLAAAYVFLDERLTPRQWLGAGLVLAAVGAIAVLQSRRPSV